MIQFKIFAGNHTCVMADELANDWIIENPDICIYSYKYQQARCGDHSICIMYEERTDENPN